MFILQLNNISWGFYIREVHKNGAKAFKGTKEPKKAKFRPLTFSRPLELWSYLRIIEWGFLHAWQRSHILLGGQDGPLNKKEQAKTETKSFTSFKPTQNQNLIQNNKNDNTNKRKWNGNDNGKKTGNHSSKPFCQNCKRVDMMWDAWRILTGITQRIRIRKPQFQPNWM